VLGVGRDPLPTVSLRNGRPRVLDMLASDRCHSSSPDGNVATEGLAWMFEGMGVRTGVDVHRLASVAEEAVRIPGTQVGGRVRDVLKARACRIEAIT
jgi:hypothetical protein